MENGPGYNHTFNNNVLLEYSEHYSCSTYPSQIEEEILKSTFILKYKKKSCEMVLIRYIGFIVFLHYLLRRHWGIMVSNIFHTKTLFKSFQNSNWEIFCFHPSLVIIGQTWVKIITIIYSITIKEIKYFFMDMDYLNCDKILQSNELRFIQYMEAN